MRYRWFDEGEGDGKSEPPSTAKDPFSPAGVKKRILAREELIGGLLAVVVLVYGMATGDIPILFLALAFLAHGMRSFTKYLGKSAGPFLSNVLKGLSLALFVGAVFLAFF